MGRITIADRLLLAAQALHAEMVVYQEEANRLHRVACENIDSPDVMFYVDQCTRAVNKWQDVTDKFQKVYRYAETFSRAIMQA